ncbi:transposable element Tcb2 transposase [Trichonephila clavipes]|nr:transposable element Tcb2 transposase [Trichonephila clavipes]
MTSHYKTLEICQNSRSHPRHLTRVPITRKKNLIAKQLKLSLEATRVSRKSLEDLKARLIENKSGRGRKSILSDVAKRNVLKDIKIDCKLSAVILAVETSRIMGRSVSAETVRNVIRHTGYSSRVARKKPFISLQNQKKRLEFAKTHQLKTDNFWKKVTFSDESKFNICGSDGRRTVWRKPNTALDPKKFTSYS